ncbi:hypothetical protein AJ79_02677 [Helicocarpus griseus UAMH5409]|uniref:Deacetylase sirtuin-type domain-containing protein n=1 Tax=Helicocarpus griseus UAMH5409 TaxID=1447875 RepID=A0A2B7Y2R8_9EURO|nr:hypothetical protein AJ79_02677 [Helicocarpus griseus UAMH5409]
MASAVRSSVVPEDKLRSFSEHLRRSQNILALLGAGISAASGLPTFRGPGGLWRSHNPTSLATPEAFGRDPGLVWQFYSHRRHMALKAQPNAAHYALAELARKNPNFITLSQNVDGLSPRANHPDSQLHLVHGSLFDIKCNNCEYIRRNDFTDPIIPALAIPKAAPQPNPSTDDKTGAEATKALYSSMEYQSESTAEGQDLDVSDANIPIPRISPDQLPKCPDCAIGLLRPGVVWFGEMLPEDTINAVDNWIAKADKIDLVLVIGTSARVYPAAEYVLRATDKGALVCVVNMDKNDKPPVEMTDEDWFFQGDASVIVPEILREVLEKP